MLRIFWFLWVIGAIELTTWVGRDVDRDARMARRPLSPNYAFVTAFLGTLVFFASPAWISLLVIVLFYPHLIGE